MQALKRSDVVTQLALKEDGVDHINIWAHGKTELGQKLSHYYIAPFKHPRFGHFRCMEGFWHWVKTHGATDQFDVLDGKRAKALGKTLPTYRCDHFRELILEGNYHKIDQNPDIKQLLLESTLPFEQYYYFGPQNVIKHPRGHDWLSVSFETLRTMFREGTKPVEYPFVPLTSRRYAPRDQSID